MKRFMSILVFALTLGFALSFGGLWIYSDTTSQWSSPVTNTGRLRFSDLGHMSIYENLYVHGGLLVNTIGTTGPVAIGGALSAGSLTAPALTGVATFVTLKGTAFYSTDLNGTTLPLKANLASPTFSGTAVFATAKGTALYSTDLNGTSLPLKANLAGPTFSGTTTFATAKGTALYSTDLNGTSFPAKANAANSALTGTGTFATLKGTALYSTDLNGTSFPLKANVASPSFTGNMQLGAGTPLIAGLFATSGTCASADNTSLSILLRNYVADKTMFSAGIICQAASNTWALGNIERSYVGSTNGLYYLVCNTNITSAPGTPASTIRIDVHYMVKP